jgi:curved DNA-binding protein CbpA
MTEHFFQQNLYQILNVNQHDDLTTIRNSYKKLMLEYHPDKLIGSTKSTEEINDQFIKIKNAWDILSDPEKRKSYDKLLSIDSCDKDNLTGIKKIDKFLIKNYKLFVKIFQRKISHIISSKKNIDILMEQMNNFNFYNMLAYIKNYNFLNIDIQIDFTLKQYYNIELYQLEYSRITTNVFCEIIYPIDHKQIYDSEGEIMEINGTKYYGDFVVNINITNFTYGNFTYQILNNDLYLTIKKNINNQQILTFTHLDDNQYTFDLDKLDKTLTDFGYLYSINDLGLPFFDNFSDSDIVNIKNCNVSRGKLFIFFS